MYDASGSRTARRSSWAPPSRSRRGSISVMPMAMIVPSRAETPLGIPGVTIAYDEEP
jgi:hypothetical protein